MNLNATLIGQSIIILIPLFAFLSYKLGKKKTTNAKMTAFLGGVLSLLPPLNFIFIAALLLKNDVVKN